VKIDVPLNVLLVLRREAIAAMAREFAFTMGVTSPATLATICDAISGGLLKEVEILLYDAQDRDQGYVFFEVDWDAHNLIVSTRSTPERFSVDLSKNIANQIAPVTAYVSSYLRAEAAARNVTRTHVIYSWVPDADKRELDALRATHSLKPIGVEISVLLDQYRKVAQKYGDDDNFPEMSSGGSFRPL
jgi:hypothetical protein